MNKIDLSKYGITGATEIFYNPSHPYTWGLNRSIPEPAIDEKHPLTPIKGNPPSLVDLPEGCPFAPRCPYATDKCRNEVPPVHTTETGHYAKCHYCNDKDFVAKNAPETSRSKAEPSANKKGADA